MPNNTDIHFTYTVHPMRESTIKAIVFWVVVVFTIWGVWLNVSSLLLTIIASAILIASLSSFYLPTTYFLDETGVSWKRLSGSKSIEWSRVRRAVDEREGLFLSPFAGRSMMENFRGLYLPYRANRDEVIEFVRRYAPDAKGIREKNPTPTKDEDLSSRPPNYFGHRK